MSIDSPQDWAHTLCDEQCWPGTSIGRDVAGTKESVSSLQRDGLLAFKDRWYVPENAVICIAGAIETATGTDLLARLFDKWASTGLERRPPAANVQYPRQTPRVYFEDRATEQVNLCLATRGIPRSSADRYGFELLTSILGGSMSSRLFLEIREHRGLAYDIQSYGNVLADTGALVTYAAVDPLNTAVVVREVLKQMRLLRTELVSQSELDKVKDYYKGSLLLGLEDTQSVAGWCGVQQALHGVIRQPEDVCAEIDRVTRQDILRLAAECFETDYLRLVAIGPQSGSIGLSDILTL